MVDLLSTPCQLSALSGRFGAAIFAGMVGAVTSPSTDRAAHAVEIPPGAVPDWVHLVPAGRFGGRDGRGPYRLDDPAAVIAATLGRGIDLVIDYDHASEFILDGGRPAPAAGWVRELEARDGAIWGRVEWTPRAADAIRDREWRYLSPVMMHTKDGRVVQLVSAAVTNLPNLPLKSLNSQETSAMDLIKRLAAILGLPDTADEAAVVTAAQSQTDLIGTLRTELGVPADAKLSAITQAAQSAVGTAKAARGALSLGPEADGAAVTKAIQARSTGEPDPAKYVPIAVVTDLQSRLGKLETKTAETAAHAIADKAIEEGRLVPAQRDWAISLHAKDPAALEDYLANAPVIVPPGTTGPGGKPSSGDGPLTPEEKAVCGQMGLDEEKYLATRKAAAEEARA